MYLRELSSAITRFPEVTMDIFTRTQNSRIRGIRKISPRVRVIHLKGGPESPVSRKNLYGFLPEFLRNFEEFIIGNQITYDLVYSHYWLSGLIGEWIRQKYHLPLIHTFHTLAFLKKRAEKDRYEEQVNRLRVERHLTHISDAVISSSEHEKKSLCREYKISPLKIRIIYPGVNEQRFYPQDSKEARNELGFREEDKIILYVGRIEPVKSLSTLIETLYIMKRKVPFLYNKLKLVIVGGGSVSSEHLKNREITVIKDLIEVSRMQDKVLFIGSKKQNQLKNYYSAADVLVMPSLYESFGLVVIEALACGTPVVGSRINEMITIIEEGKNGFYFNPGDPDSLFFSLNHFFSQRNTLWDRKKVRKNIISRFSWNKTAEETYTFFKEMVKSSVYEDNLTQPDERPQSA